MNFLLEAIKEARIGIEKGNGGPFGAVIVKNGEIIGRGHNRVIAKNDPTAHAEIEAIRDACKNINNFDLSGCEMYVTAKPCPMCFGAIHWARLERVYYGASSHDVAKIGFDDEKFYKIIKGEIPDNIEFIYIKCNECLKVFEEWYKNPNKIIY